jgi:hypothetical protein
VREFYTVKGKIGSTPAQNVNMVTTSTGKTTQSISNNAINKHSLTATQEIKLSAISVITITS